MASFPVSVSRRRARDATSNFKFPSDIGPHGILLTFRDYNYQTTRSFSNEGTTSSSSIIGSVILPLPRQLVDQTNLRLNRVDLGNIGEVAASAMAQGKGEVEAIATAIASQLPSGKMGADAVTDLARHLAGFDVSFSKEFMDQVNFLARRTINGILDSRSLDIGTGKAINPKTAISFEGVNMREYDFDFELMPRTPEESDMIRNISNFIHRQSLPEYQDLTLEGNTVLQRVFLKYPAVVDITLLGVDEDYYMKFKPCMIQRFSVNLTPTGGHQHAILKGGRPAMVTFNITFTELDIRTRADYNDQR